ncbi:M50 family metallopeptidase [Gordonia shandongensis]|uniref:M50 family metallopeptidase n=1 Tax=Gordonia shandongensis TaxID=376351 RepID=UPI00040C9717|nr:M50 family metallopeptidase [Gordonia shandongensis]
MSLALGIVLFAIALLVSIAWHELGHMWAAKATGMKVRRYFVGFGPTLWSRRVGETEYGIKALPLGGFCDIAGMTPYDQLSDEDAPRAMYRQSTWKRLVVLLAGPFQNFVLGFVLIVIAALGWGLPVLNPDPVPVHVAKVECVAATTDAEGNPEPCTGPAPAADAGLRVGDRLVSVNGRAIDYSGDLVREVQDTSRPVDLVVERDGRELDLTIPVSRVQRMVSDDGGQSVRPAEVGAIGVTMTNDGTLETVRHYDALSVWGGAISFTGELGVETGKALISLPSKVAGLWTAVTGGERAVDSPVSVVGASVLGGEAVERGYWDLFVMLLLSVNFFLGAFNLVPLLPLDGGHMAIALYERVRNSLRRWSGRAPAGPVDYYKLLPLTYAVIVVMAGFMLLTLTADIVNPIKLFG